MDSGRVLRLDFLFSATAKDQRDTMCLHIWTTLVIRASWRAERKYARGEMEALGASILVAKTWMLLGGLKPIKMTIFLFSILGYYEFCFITTTLSLGIDST